MFVPAGIVAFEAAVDVSVSANAPAVIRLEPVISVSVALVVGAVIVTLLIDVAVATPRIGVTSVGVVARTLLPIPVFATIESAPPTPVV